MVELLTKDGASVRARHRLVITETNAEYGARELDDRRRVSRMLMQWRSVDCAALEVSWWPIPTTDSPTRHAGNKLDWPGPDVQRPLDLHGEHTAELLAKVVGGHSVRRLISSPTTR